MNYKRLPSFCKGVFVSLLLAGPQSGFAGSEYETVAIAKHTVVFNGVLQNSPASGQSTWFYTITSGAKPAISHVTYSLDFTGLVFLGAGMWEWDEEHPGALSSVKRYSKAGKPEPGSFPGTPKGDPTTNLVGLKFDLGFEEGQTQHYYFIVNGNYTAGPMVVALKAGNGFNTGSISGPTSDQSIESNPSSIGDFVWNDLDSDGVQDAGEPGVGGVLVSLLSKDDEVLATTNTTAEGSYIFEKLVDGQYRIRFTQPAGYLFTSTSQDDEKDSDADQLTGKTELLTLAPNTNRWDVDAGLIVSTAAITLKKTGTFVAGSLDPWALCTVFGPAHAFNALIFGNFSTMAGDTEGRLAIAGNAVIPSGYCVGQSTPFIGHPVAETFGGVSDMLIVGGMLSDGSWGLNGNVVHGGERTGPVRWMSNGNVVRHVTPITLRKDGNVPSDGSGMSFDALREKLQAKSDAFAALSDRGVVRAGLEGGGPNLELVGNDDVLNVFNVEASLWSGVSREIKIMAPSSSTVLVNVRGRSIGITNSSMSVTEVSAEKVLVHYVDAETLATAGFSHTASVLAMKACAEFSGGAIDGRAIFGGSVMSRNGFEFHNYYFLGDICTDGGVHAQPPHVDYSFAVHNTGNVPLNNVVVNDPLVTVNGEPLTLLPDATDSTSFSATLYPSEAQLALGVLTNTAEVVARTVAGHIVNASDSHVVNFPAQEQAVQPIVVQNPSAINKPDFVICSVDITPSPTLTGTRFTAQVRIANEGQVAGDAGNLEFWSGLSEYSSSPVATPEKTVAVGIIQMGTVVVVEVTGLQAPLVNGTHHAVAVVNRSGPTLEWSKGNNHGSATYTLEALTVKIATTAGGLTVSWNSVPGYYYFLERAGGLDQPFTDIANNLSATPPVNQYIDATVPPSGAFYRVWGYAP